MVSRSAGLGRPPSSRPPCCRTKSTRGPSAVTVDAQTCRSSPPDRYKELVLVGGDLNTSTAWEDPSHRVRDQGVLDRFESYGLVDCLRKMRGSARLENCTCIFGNECNHTWTRVDPRSSLQVPYQMDYLFASAALADRLKTCEALPPMDWREYSDHAPIIASFV
jgi:exonuclease III